MARENNPKQAARLRTLGDRSLPTIARYLSPFPQNKHSHGGKWLRFSLSILSVQKQSASSGRNPNLRHWYSLYLANQYEIGSK
jgi:hypothetical protein